MKRVLVTTAAITVCCVIGSLALVSVVSWVFGARMDAVAWTMSIVCPLLLAPPSCLYMFAQQARLRTAIDALQAAHEALEEAHAKLSESASRDHMTGLLNRESFFAELRGGRRQSDRGVLLIIDADHFKAINDRFGHQAGDAALRDISAAIMRGVCATDLVARIGGEEFAALLCGASATEGVAVAERIRREVEAVNFHPAGASEPHPLTVSIGGAELTSDGALSERLRDADRYLYLAKQNGRNQTAFDPRMLAAA